MYLNEMPDYSELFSSEPKMWAHLQELSAQAAEFLSNA
jgi:hypothetical protein